MVIEGVRLMAVGMSTVFGFLTLLVAAIHATSAVVAMFPEPEAQPGPGGSTADATDDEAIAAVLAIVAAQRRTE